MTEGTVGKVMSPEKLLYSVMTSPGDEQLLAQLRARSSEVLEAIDVQDIVLPQAAVEALDEPWIAKVYEALAGTVVTAEEEKTSKALFAASAADIESIGAAFKETLLPGLPLELTNFPHWFASVPRVPIEQVAILSTLPDVKAAFPISAQLIVYGITPSTIYYASEGVAAVIDRLMRSEAIPERHGVVLQSDQPLVVETEGKEVPVDLDEEIARMAECEIVPANAIRGWLLRVAEYKPQLFGGFESEPVSGGVRLRRAAGGGSRKRAFTSAGGWYLPVRDKPIVGVQSDGDSI